MAARSMPAGRSISADELAALLGTADEPFVLDVREPDEFADWSIPSAVNVPLGQLGARLSELPEDRRLVCVCASGNRSSTAVELLVGSGRQAANLEGGMAAWAVTYDTVAIDLGEIRLVQVRRRGKGCLSYLVGAGGEALVIDPSADTELYRRLAASEGWRITRLFETHLHADHLSGARRLRHETGASLHLNPADPFGFDYEPVGDGETFALASTAQVVTALHTPGHTRGSTVYVVGDRAVCSGDTVFVDGVGRPDLADRAEEFAHDLFRSLRQRLVSLGDGVLVLPAHYGPGVAVVAGRPVATTMGDVRRLLTTLPADEESFVTWAAAQSGPRPPNYAAIVETNLGRSEAPLEDQRRLELGPNRCAATGR